jgi:hypothetical protein
MWVKNSEAKTRNQAARVVKIVSAERERGKNFYKNENRGKNSTEKVYSWKK